MVIFYPFQLTAYDFFVCVLWCLCEDNSLLQLQKHSLGDKKKKKKDKPSQWFYIHVFMGKSLCSKHKAKNCLTESELDQQLLWLSKECPTVSEFHAVEKEMFGRQLLNSFHVIFFPGTLKEISEKIFCVFNFL